MPRKLSNDISPDVGTLQAPSSRAVSRQQRRKDSHQSTAPLSQRSLFHLGDTSPRRILSGDKAALFSAVALGPLASCKIAGSSTVTSWPAQLIEWAAYSLFLRSSSAPRRKIDALTRAARTPSARPQMGSRIVEFRVNYRFFVIPFENEAFLPDSLAGLWQKRNRCRRM